METKKPKKKIIVKRQPVWSAKPGDISNVYVPKPTDSKSNKRLWWDTSNTH